MSVSSTATLERDVERPEATRRTTVGRGHVVLVADIVATGAAIAAWAVHDGTWVGRLLRLVLVVAATTGVLWASRWSSRRARGIALFAAGVLAFAFGAGLGGPHLAKAGPALGQLAGTVAFVGGAALMAVGAVQLLAAVGRWWRVPIGLVLLAVSAVTLLSVAQAVAATNVPRPPVGGRTPADAGLAYEDVRFTTDDGVSISGWYVPSRNGAAVVVVHGAGSTRSSVLEHATVLAEHGYGVLLFDARGHGRSAGRAMDFGWYGELDVGAAVAFTARQDDVDPDRIGVLGLSMGGEEALGAAAAHPEIRAVVAEGATNRVAADKDWLSDAYGVRGWLQERIDSLTYLTTDLLTDADPPPSLRAAVRAMAPRSALLVAAGDVPEEEHAGRHIREGAPGSVELWVAGDAGHTDALESHPDEWRARILGFFDRELAP